VIPEDSAALAAHNERVRALADVMPAGALTHAVCAIGYRADKHTGITSGYSIPTMARLSQGQPWEISPRELDRAIRVLAPAGVIEIRRPPAKDGKRQANDYEPDYGYKDRERLSEAWEMGKRQRRPERQRRAGKSVTTVTIPADDEAERLAALGDYPEPPEPPELAAVPGCPVCEGRHDLTHGGNPYGKFGCRDCQRHDREPGWQNRR